MITIDRPQMVRFRFTVGRSRSTVEAKIEAKRAAMASATTTALLADSGKFGHFAKYRVLSLDELDTVVCDPALGDDDTERIESLGIDVVRAPLA